MSALYSVIVTLVTYFFVLGLLNWFHHIERRKNRYSPFTENMLRSPGYGLGQQLDLLRDKLIWPILMVFFLPSFYIWFAPQGLIAQLSSGAILGVVAIVSIILIRRWYLKIQMLKLGLDCEVYTGQELNFLMQLGAWVYHDIPYQYGNIDHIVVSIGGGFAVETKGVRKPKNEKGGRGSKVQVFDGKLHFPHCNTDCPIKQAQRHASHLGKFLARRTGKVVPVSAVVALPGWYVEQKEKTEFMVINPKRGGGLRYRVSRSLIDQADLVVIANAIEDFARSVRSATDTSDPDANKKYDFWLNRKPEESRLR